MIREIGITNLGVIEHVGITLDRGLTVLTGETGAGKTLITTGISQLLGAKPDAGLIRHGAEEAAIDCVLEVSASMQEQLDDLGATMEDGEVVVTRTIGARSRAVVGGRPVAAAVLAEILRDSVTLHGQHGQVRLTRAAEQRAVLDASDPTTIELLAVQRQAWSNRRAAEAALADAESATAASQEELTALRALCDDVERVAPQPGEMEELDRRIAFVTAQEAIGQALQVALRSLSDDDADADVLTQLAGVRREFEHRHEVPEFAAWTQRLADLQDEASALAREIADYALALEADEGSLDALMTRRGQLLLLAKRWGGSLEEVAARALDASRAVALADDPTAHLEQCRSLLRHCQAEEELACAALHAARAAAAERLAAAVAQELRDLALPHAEFAIEVMRRNDPGQHGDDTVEFRFSANPGQPLQPLSAVASGGELSRVMLALESATAAEHAHTLVFDEIDAGIGGRAALEVGRRLADLAQRHQVVVVTHLAQVAAFADLHIVVEKSVQAGTTVTTTRALGEGERPQELARMLSGVEDSATAAAHAAELLALATRRPV